MVTRDEIQQRLRSWDLKAIEHVVELATASPDAPWLHELVQGAGFQSGRWTFPEAFVGTSASRVARISALIRLVAVAGELSGLHDLEELTVVTQGATLQELAVLGLRSLTVQGDARGVELAGLTSLVEVGFADALIGDLTGRLPGSIEKVSLNRLRDEVVSLAMFQELHQLTFLLGWRARCAFTHLGALRRLPLTRLLLWALDDAAELHLLPHLEQLYIATGHTMSVHHPSLKRLSVKGVQTLKLGELPALLRLSVTGEGCTVETSPQASVTHLHLDAVALAPLHELFPNLVGLTLHSLSATLAEGTAVESLGGSDIRDLPSVDLPALQRIEGPGLLFDGFPRGATPVTWDAPKDDDGCTSLQMFRGSDLRGVHRFGFERLTIDAPKLRSLAGVEHADSLRYLCVHNARGALDVSMVPAHVELHLVDCPHMSQSRWSAGAMYDRLEDWDLDQVEAVVTYAQRCGDQRWLVELMEGVDFDGGEWELSGVFQEVEPEAEQDRNSAFLRLLALHEGSAHLRVHVIEATILTRGGTLRELASLPLRRLHLHGDARQVDLSGCLSLEHVAFETALVGDLKGRLPPSVEVSGTHACSGRDAQ